MLLEQVHVRLPVALDRADVLPVALELVAEDARASVEHGRDDVAPEVGARLVEPLQQRLLREDVDAQRGKVALGLLRLLLPLGDLAVVVEREDPEALASPIGTR